jgi:hypothetical protein
VGGTGEIITFSRSKRTMPLVKMIRGGQVTFPKVIMFKNYNEA